jgi:hypothetical protein
LANDGIDQAFVDQGLQAGRGSHGALSGTWDIAADGAQTMVPGFMK